MYENYDTQQAGLCDIWTVPLSRNGVDQAIKRLGKRAGLPHIHPHLFRHSYAVAFLLNGGDIFALQRNLGHQDIGVTRVYVDYVETHLHVIQQRVSPMDRVMLPPDKRRKR